MSIGKGKRSLIAIGAVALIAATSGCAALNDGAKAKFGWTAEFETDRTTFETKREGGPIEFAEVFVNRPRSELSTQPTQRVANSAPVNIGPDNGNCEEAQKHETRNGYDVVRSCADGDYVASYRSDGTVIGKPQFFKRAS